MLSPAALGVLLIIQSVHTQAIKTQEFVYDYAPFPSCHASTLIETHRGELVCAWFGGLAESDLGTAIFVSQWKGGEWSDPVLAASGREPAGKRFACYNPVLVQAPGGRLLLFYKTGLGPQTWTGKLVRSRDGGKTWSSPESLPVGIYGPIKNKPYHLAGGRILCPSSTEDHGWRIHFEVTDKDADHWDKSEPLNDPSLIGAIQPSILCLGGTHLRAIGRTQQGKLFAIDSLNEGKTWGEMRLLDVPNPNSGTDALTLRDGRHLLVYNPVTSGRTPLSVAISTDGETWNKVLDLETEPGEYSYPAVIQTKDGMVHITYTWKRKKIRHVVVDPNGL